MFIYQCKMIKLFLVIFRKDKSIFKHVFWPSSDPELCWQTLPVDRAVDRRAQTCARLIAQWAGRPGGRPDQRALLSVSGRSADTVDQNREFALCIWAVDRDCPTVIFLTVGGRPGRSTASLSGWQLSLTASFLFGLYKPHSFGIFIMIFKSKNSRLS